jgi:hypothetical protein
MVLRGTGETSNVPLLVRSYTGCVSSPSASQPIRRYFTPQCCTAFSGNYYLDGQRDTITEADSEDLSWIMLATFPE